MSRFLRKIGLMLVMVMIAGLLTGCSAGSTVDTVLNINEDLSGSRVMTLVVDQSVYDQYFTGTVEQLNAVIAEKCPEGLTWVYDDSTGIMTYIFTINFVSPADYKTKVDKIIGGESDVELTITKAESVWASGIYVEENFSTSEILNWLKTASVEAGFISESNSSKLFNLGDNTVVFAGTEYGANSNISVNKITYVEIDRIDLLTDASQYDAYNKSIIMTIPEESMKLKGEDIKAWLATKVPAGAAAVWTTEGTDSIYTVTKSGMTAEELQTFLNEFFATELCTVTQTDIREDMSPFSFNFGLVETVDFTNYLVGDILNQVDINYYVKGANGYVGGRNLSNLASYDENDDISPDYAGYRHGRVDYNNALLRDFSAYFQKIYRVSDVTVETSLGLFGDLKREIKFSLTGEPTEEEQAVILDKINALGVAYDRQQEAVTEETTEDATETTTETTTENATESGTEQTTDEKPSWSIQLKDETKDGKYVLTIVQSGSRADIQASTKALFDCTNDLYYAENYHFSKLNYNMAVYDRLSFGKFVDYTEKEATSTYILKTGLGSELTNTNVGEQAVLKDNTLTMKDSVLYGVNVIAYGNQFNIWALIFYVLVVIVVISVLVILVKLGVFKMLISFIQEKMAASKGSTPVITVDAKDVEIAPIKEIPMFCENCGAKRDTDALVCTECGTKFED